jgi:hypothetical protein
MINFKNKDDVGPSALILLSILVLLGALIYMVFVPPPTTKGLVKRFESSRLKLVEETDALETRGEQARLANQSRLWESEPQKVTASVLAQLTHEAALQKLKLAAFRPQRTQRLESLTEVPFTVQVSGPYSAVRQFTAMIDAANSKLALRSFQLASSDGASDAVTATLGVSAYCAQSEKTIQKEEKNGR